MDVVRDHRAGHIGATPQDTDGIVAGGRVAGMQADFDAHLQPPWVDRVDAYLPVPQVAQAPGYFSDEWTMIQITGAVARAQPGLLRQGQMGNAKAFGGYDPTGDS